MTKKENTLEMNLPPIEPGDGEIEKTASSKGDNTSRQTDSSRLDLQKHAFKVSWVTAIISSVLILNSLRAYFQDGNLGSVYGQAPTVIVALLSMLLARRGRPGIGITLIVVTLTTLMPVSSFISQGLGFFLGLLAVIWGGLILFLATPPKYARGVFAWAVAMGLFTWLSDVFGSPARQVSGLTAQTAVTMILFVTIMYLAFFWRRFSNVSVQIKITAVLTLVVVVTLVAVTVISAQNVESALSDQISTSYQDEAEAIGELTGAFFKEKIGQLQLLASLELVKDAVEERNASYTGTTNTIVAEIEALDARWIAANDNSPLIQRIISANPDINPIAFQMIDIVEDFSDHAEVFVTDRYGATVAASNRLSDYYQADEDWWQGAWNGGEGAVYISDPEYDESADTVGVLVAIPVYSEAEEGGEEEGQVIGVVRTTLLLDEILDTIGAVRIGETGHAVLFADPDLVLYDPYADQEGSVTLPPEVRQKFFSAEEVQFFIDIDQHGDEAIFAHAPAHVEGFGEFGRHELVEVEDLDRLEIDIGEGLRALNWVVVIRQESSEAFAAISTLTTAITFAGTFATVLAVLLGLYVTRILTRPLDNLSEAADRLGSGNLAARADVQTVDEFGLLAGVFNSMADELQTTLEGMESTIQRRTAQLSERTTQMEASQRVTFAATERTSPEDFLELLVNLVKDQFDIYHAQVYLLNEDEGTVVLEQSTGYAGRQLLQRGHTLRMDQPSLVATAINEDRSVVVPDTAQDPNWASNPLLPLTRSELVVPLRLEGKVIGALDVQDREVNRFTKDVAPVFETMAEQVAFLFENNELLEQITKQTADLERFTSQLRQVAEAANQLSSILDPTQLINEAIVIMQSFFGVFNVYIYLVDEDTDELVVQMTPEELAAESLPESAARVARENQESAVAWAGREMEPVIITDRGSDRNDTEKLSNLMYPESRSELAIPLVVAGRLVGVLNILDDQPDRFSATDADTFSALGGQVASSLENANLFMISEQNRKATEIRYDVGQALSGNLTEDEVLDRIMEKVGIYDKAEVTISLLDPLAHEPTFESVRNTPLESTLIPVELGLRFPMSEFTMVEILSPTGPTVFDNILTDERMDETTRMYNSERGVVSIAVVPFLSGGEWMGIFWLCSKEEGYFDSDKVLLYQSLAEQGAQALRSARLYDEQRRAEQAVQASEKRLSQLILKTPLAVIEWDTEFIARQWNPSAEQIFGYKAEEAIGKHAGDLVVPEEARSRAAKIWGDLLARKGNEQITFENITKDGRRIYCEWYNTHLVDENDEVIGISSQAVDITERKDAEETIIQGDRLKSEFLANMSHELRTPLNSIIGYTDVLLEGIDGELDDEIMADVEAIHENSQNLLSIINDILDLAKIEAGRMILELSDVDVKTLLDDAKTRALGLIGDKPIQVEVSLDGRIPNIQGDSVRIIQVLNNLVSNAVKFTPEGEISLNASQDGEFVTITVEDTGTGISEDDLETIFDEFAQADSSASRAVEGTGLGLTITRRLVQMHGGSMDVESRLGEGSVFSVRLPIEARVPAEISVVHRDAKTHAGNGAPTTPVAKRVTGMLKEAIGIKDAGDGKGDNEKGSSD